MTLGPDTLTRSYAVVGMSHFPDSMDRLPANQSLRCAGLDAFDAVRQWGAWNFERPERYVQVLVCNTGENVVVHWQKTGKMVLVDKPAKIV